MERNRPMSASKAGPTSGGKLRLKDFEKKIKVRRLTLADYDDLVAMQKRCFPGMLPWARDQIESQLSIFPEGQLCVEYEGRLVASSNSLIVDYDRYEEWHDWKRVADGGFIRNHTYDGDTLYGIEIMVDPEYRGMHLARRLYNARKEACREFNLARIVVGGRIPGFGAQPEEMTAREYVEKVIERGLHDLVLTTQVANGFVLRELIPDYFPSDRASRGYATHLEWTNLDYVRDPKKRWHRVSTVRLCAVQYQLRSIASWEEFCTQCSYFMDAAAYNKADFVLFPELITTQLLGLQEERRPADAVRSLATRTPDYLDFFTRAAVKYNINVVGGSQFTLEGDRLFNVAYLFRRDGTIERQPKLHITADEQRWWGVEAGDEFQVFDTDRGKIAILPSYDVNFPELGRVAAARGAQIFFVRWPAPWRMTCSWRSRGAPATCPSWPTPTSTTPSRASSPRWTSPSPATASPPSAPPTSRRWSWPTWTWSCCVATGMREPSSPGVTDATTCIASSGGRRERSRSGCRP